MASRSRRAEGWHRIGIVLAAPFVVLFSLRFFELWQESRLSAVDDANWSNTWTCNESTSKVISKDTEPVRFDNLYRSCVYLAVLDRAAAARKELLTGSVLYWLLPAAFLYAACRAIGWILDGFRP